MLVILITRPEMFTWRCDASSTTRTCILVGICVLSGRFQFATMLCCEAIKETFLGLLLLVLALPSAPQQLTKVGRWTLGQKVQSWKPMNNKSFHVKWFFFQFKFKKVLDKGPANHYRTLGADSWCSSFGTRERTHKLQTQFIRLGRDEIRTITLGNGLSLPLHICREFKFF